MSAGFGENERARLRKIMDALPSAGARGRKRLEHLIASGAQSDDPPEFALDGVLLVDDVQDPRWQWLGRARLTTDERAYDEVLVLADLARSDACVARALAPRMEQEEQRRAARLARKLLDPTGPALPEDVRECLSTIASRAEPQKP
jgi:hypothetical protein